MIESAYISLGSNLGDRAGNLLLAVRGMLDANLLVRRLSRIYETQPVDHQAQPLFLNMVAELAPTCLPPAEQLLARLLRIEYGLLRTRDIDKGPRTIDLDLLIYKQQLHGTQFLTIPHPRMHLRRFVLQPLNELAPTLVHPILNVTVQELLTRCEDVSDVKLWRPETTNRGNG